MKTQKIKKMKKLILKNVMAVAAIAITLGSYGLMSFDRAETSKSEELVWFHVVDNKIQQDMEEPAGPNGDCLTTNPASTICLAGFYTSELTTTGEAPTEDPNETDHLAYRANP